MDLAAFGADPHGIAHTATPQARRNTSTRPTCALNLDCRGVLGVCLALGFPLTSAGPPRGSFTFGGKYAIMYLSSEPQKWVVATRWLWLREFKQFHVETRGGGGHPGMCSCAGRAEATRQGSIGEPHH